MLKDEKINFLKFKYKIRISHKVKDENNILPLFFVLIKEALNTYILVQYYKDNNFVSISQ